MSLVIQWCTHNRFQFNCHFFAFSCSGGELKEKRALFCITSIQETGKTEKNTNHVTYKLAFICNTKTFNLGNIKWPKWAKEISERFEVLSIFCSVSFVNIYNLPTELTKPKGTSTSLFIKPFTNTEQHKQNI